MILYSLLPLLLLLLVTRKLFDQGFPVMTLANFEEVLSMTSSLAMKGSFFVGELPAWLAETDIENRSNTKQWVDILLISKGFRVEMINYEGFAESLGKDFSTGHYNNILFVAEQLRHSDDQVRQLVFRLTWQCMLVYFFMRMLF